MKINMCAEQLDTFDQPRYKVGIPRIREMFTSKGRGLVRKSNIGHKVGSIYKDGYVVVSVDGERIYEHVLVYAIYHGRWPDYRLTHYDGDRSNNSLDNILEEGEKYIRMSKHIGVRFDPEAKDWVTLVFTNELRTKVLGHYESEGEAALAYNEYNLSVFGETSILNEV